MIESYRKSRNTAWAMLIRHKVGTLPVNLYALCKSEDIRVYSYAEAREEIRALGISEQIRRNDAFSFCGMIFYNSANPVGQRRFAIAHEIGHLIMHNDRITDRNIAPEDEENEHEREANMFAARLLSPAIVLERIGVTSPEQIAELCNVSVSAAIWRYKRLEELRTRDAEFLTRYGKGCFGMSPAERQVERQFRDYIASHKM